MENPNNKSIDNLRGDAVNGGEIKGGGSVVNAPDVMGAINPITGALNLPGEPTAAVNAGIADPLPLDGGVTPVSAADDASQILPDGTGLI